MNKYKVSHVSISGSGTSDIKASSASDAKAICESKYRAGVAYKVKGPEGTIDFMSYSEALKLRDARK